MHVVIVFVAMGTRGDVEPICCLAEHLRRSGGFDCHVITHAKHEVWLSKPPFHRLTLSLSPTPPHHADEQTQAHIRDALLALPCKPSIVTFNLFALETAHICLAPALGYRSVALSTYSPPYPCPASFESYFTSTYGPGLHSQLVKEEAGIMSWSEIIAWSWPLLSERWDRLRSSLGLPPSLLDGPLPPSIPLIMSQPEGLHPRPGFWPQSMHTTGFWLPCLTWYEDDDKLANQLILDGTVGPGSSFVCIDLASSGDLGFIHNPCHLLRVVARSLEGLKVRGLMLTSGWRPVQEAYESLISTNPQDLRFLHVHHHPLDHTLMFRSQRVLAIVHPGGSGTLAAALSRGVPQVLFPLHYDQFRSTERLYDLGAIPAALEVGMFLGEKENENEDLVERGSISLRNALDQAMSPIIRSVCVQLGTEVQGGGLDEAMSILLSYMQ